MNKALYVMTMYSFFIPRLIAYIILMQSIGSNLSAAYVNFSIGQRPPYLKQKVLFSNLNGMEKGFVSATFVAQKKMSSFPPTQIPGPNTPDAKIQTLSQTKYLREFFEISDHKNLLLSKSGDVVIIESPPQDMIKKWSVESKLMGGFDISKDNINDKTCEVIQIITDVQFPGLILHIVTTHGSKLVIDSEDGFPEYQFTLLKTEILPEGKKPVKWLFNKLTGAGRLNMKDEGGKPLTSSFSRFSVKETADGESMVFVSDAFLQVNLKIPGLLIGILPMNLSKFEETGSKSLQKAIEKDIKPALERFRSTYVNRIS